MDLARTHSGDLPATQAAVDPFDEQIHYCNYCGAPLDSRYYFCIACSTPYKHPETVLPGVDRGYIAPGTLIATRAPSALPLFWTYVVVVVASSLVANFAFDHNDVGGQLIFGTVMIGLTTCIVAAIYWRSLATQLKRLGFFHPAAWIGIACLGPLLGLNYLYNMVFLRWAGANFDPLGDPRWSQWGSILIICVLPAITEELAFRGLLQHWLRAALTPMRALLIASALFAALHASVLSFPYLFLVGMVLGWTKWKTQSLYPSMVIHFLHNLFVIEFLWTVH